MVYGLWKDNLLDFNTLLLTTYKELGLNEQEYVLLVLLARLLKQILRAGRLVIFQHI